jgi:choline dehydrogenase
MQTKKFDFIIVGAGASGCVIAYNLIMNNFTVALVDSGNNYDDNYNVKIPFQFGNLWGDVTYAPPYNPPWNEWCFPSVSGNEPFVYDYVRAACLGGCANHHAMVAFRGKPYIYDEWAKITNDPSWKYENCKKYFEKIEKVNNSKKGWLSINHTEPELFDLKMLYTITNNFNIPLVENTIEDQNGIGFWNFMITQNGERSSSSISLISKILNHPNLTFISDHLVTKVLFENKTAKGVEIAKGRTLYKANTEYQATDKPIEYSELYCCKEVILCGGAINSPQILMLSGIGNKTMLDTFDIKIINDLPEVGQNLMDHPEMWNNYQLFNIQHRWQIYFPFSFDNPIYNEYKKWNNGPYKVPFSSIGLNYTTESNYDLHIGIYTIPSNNFNVSEWFYDYNYTENTYASFLIENSKPKSKGYISLQSNSPFDIPYINEELNTDENATAIAEGVIKMREIISSISEWSPKEVYPTNQNGDPLNFEELKQFFKQKSSYGHHMCGTCSMSKVVDSNGLVYGVDKLRIVDASIFPTIVSANPCLPVYMVAEKISDVIISLYKKCQSDIYQNILQNT